MNSSAYILSLTIWVPIAAGILTLLLNGEQQKTAARWTALIGSVLGLLASVPLWTGFDNATALMQFRENTPWITRFNINYALGVDGLSMLFILLNSFTTVLVVIAGWEVIKEKVSQYFAAFLIMSGLINGVFAATDAMLFYLFFEAMLIPMFLIIGVWGGPRRVYAAVKFFLYTLLGSLLMLAAFIYLYNVSNGSFNILDYHKVPVSLDVQKLLFIAFFASFAVKVPMWPVHTWLPDAHVEAPTGGSVILAAIMLKIGGYGFLRFSLPIVPDASTEWAWLIILLSLLAVVYIGFVALVQEDMKKLIAYSSIAHMGFVTLATFIVFSLVRIDGNLDAARLSLQGGMVQMISHGFISGAMFSCVGILYDRMHSRMIKDYGGVINTMPWFAGFFVFFAMANAGLPGTSGFVGEFMIIIASFQAHPLIAFFAAITLILGAAYTLWMVKRVVFGDVANHHVAELTDITAREAWMLGLFALGVLALGVYPKPLIDLMDAPISALVNHLVQTKL